MRKVFYHPIRDLCLIQFTPKKKSKLDCIFSNEKEKEFHLLSYLSKRLALLSHLRGVQVMVGII